MKEIRKIIREVILQEEVIDKILYHGSPYKFWKFKPQLTFFSDTEQFAEDYALQKSMDAAMDQEPNIYKVQVTTDLFDIRNKEDYEKIKKAFPDKATVYLSNFPFPTDMSKDDILMNMQGYDIEYPYEAAMKAKVGEEFPDPYYNYDSYKVYKIDNDFVYAYPMKSFNHKMEDGLKDPFDVHGPRKFVEPFTPFRDYVEKYIEELTGKNYVQDNYIKAYIFAALSGKSYLVDMKDLTPEFIVEANRLYDNAKKEVIQLLIDNGYSKKFIKKSRQVELDDTWRYFENDVVVNLISKMGYGGYVAKESKVYTYAIFNPEKDAKILTYEFPSGFAFSSQIEYKKYNQYYKYIYENYGEDTYRMNRWDVFRMFKEGVPQEQALAKIKQEKK